MAVARLWSWRLSPFAAKARIAFAEKGVDVRLLEIDPRNRPARLRELNPTGRVPALEVDGTGIPESTVICEWLEDQYPDPPFWPSDPKARAVGRALLRYVDEELTRAFFLSMRYEAFGVPDTEHADIVEHLRSQLSRGWAAIERQLKKNGGPWLLVGDQPTLADLAAIPLAVRLPEWKPGLVPDPGQHPLIDQWLDRLRGWPSSAEVDRAGEKVGGE